MNELATLLYVKMCGIIQHSNSLEDLDEIKEQLNTLSIMVEDRKEDLNR